MCPVSLTRRDPFTTARRDSHHLQAAMRRMLEGTFDGAPSASAAIPQTIGFVPPVEIAEADGGPTVTAELPGMDRADVHVELDGNVRTTRGEKQEAREEGDEK